MKKIVIINGGAGVGKSTFVNICKKYLKVSEASTVDLAKKAASILVGYNNEKDEITRKMLSDLKIVADNYNNNNMKYLCNRIEEFYKNDAEILFLYIREPKDIQYISCKYNVKTLLIKNSTVNPINSNIGDASVENYQYDYEIFNNGIEDFEKEANNFIDWLNDMEEKWIKKVLH